MANKNMPLVGVNVDMVYDGTTTDGENAPFALGLKVVGAGVEYTFVQAGAAISTTTSEPYMLAIDENYQAVKLTTANAKAWRKVGAAPRQIIADNAFFWARTKGSPIALRVAASAAADQTLKTTTTAGRMGSASTASAVWFPGVVLVTAASASTSAGNSIRDAIISANNPTATGATAGGAHLNS